MKKFFYLSIIALFFTACVKPPQDTPIFSVKYYNADGQLTALKDGQTIEINTFDEGLPTKLLFKGVIYSQESFNLEVTATREVVEGTFDEFCAFLNCVPSNGEAVQNFSFSVNQEESEFYAHFDAVNNGDYKIIYNFHEKEKPNAKIVITVIYKYKLS